MPWHDPNKKWLECSPPHFQGMAVFRSVAECQRQQTYWLDQFWGWGGSARGKLPNRAKISCGFSCASVLLRVCGLPSAFAAVLPGSSDRHDSDGLHIPRCRGPGHWAFFHHSGLHNLYGAPHTATPSVARDQAFPENTQPMGCLVSPPTHSTHSSGRIEKVCRGPGFNKMQVGGGVQRPPTCVVAYANVRGFPAP